VHKHRSRSRTQEAPRLLWNSKIHFIVQKYPKHCTNLQNNSLNSTESIFYAIFRPNLYFVPI